MRSSGSMTREGLAMSETDRIDAAHAREVEALRTRAPAGPLR